MPPSQKPNNRPKRDNRHWRAIQTAYRAWTQSPQHASNDDALRQLIRAEFAIARLSGSGEAFKKAKRWKILHDILRELSYRPDLKAVSDQLAQVADWIDEGDIQTLGLEHSIRDYALGTPPEPHPNCRVTVLDLLRLRQCGTLNDTIITAALNTICSRVSGAATYPILSRNISLNICKQPINAIRARK